MDEEHWQIKYADTYVMQKLYHDEIMFTENENTYIAVPKKSEYYGRLLVIIKAHVQFRMQTHKPNLVCVLLMTFAPMIN